MADLTFKGLEQTRHTHLTVTPESFFTSLKNETADGFSLTQRQANT